MTEEQLGRLPPLFKLIVLQQRVVSAMCTPPVVDLWPAVAEKKRLRELSAAAARQWAPRTSTDGALG